MPLSVPGSRPGRQQPRPPTVPNRLQGHSERNAERIDGIASLSIDLAQTLDVTAELLTIGSLVEFAAPASVVTAPTLLAGSFSAGTVGDSSYVAGAQKNASSNPAIASLGGLARNTYDMKMAAAAAFNISPSSIGGRAYRPYKSDHTTGHAIDIPGSGTLGQSIAEWAIEHAAQYSVKYIIHAKRIWYPGKGWKVYNPSAAVTGFASDALHLHHVHVSTY